MPRVPGEGSYAQVSRALSEDESRSDGRLVDIPYHLIRAHADRDAKGTPSGATDLPVVGQRRDAGVLAQALLSWGKC